MTARQYKKILNVLVLVLTIALIVWAAPELLSFCGWDFHDNGPHAVRTSYIIQGGDLLEVAALVHHEGGEITHTLPIINAVGARLTTNQLRAIRKSKMFIRIDIDETVKTISVSST